MADDVLLERRHLLALASASAIGAAGCTQSESGDEQAGDPQFGYGGNPVQTRLDQSDGLASPNAGERDGDEQDTSPPSRSPSPPPLVGGGGDDEEAAVPEPQTYDVVDASDGDYRREVSGTSVTVVGELLDLRDASAAECWFRCRRAGSEPPRDTDRQTLSGRGTFEAEITDLRSDATYGVWALASIGDERFAGTIATIST